MEFKKKIREIRKLKHPNLINLHHFFEDESHIYLILDDICGGNLFLMFEEQKKRYFERQSFIIFYQLCLVVEFLHRKKIIHKRINVLLYNFSLE